jgi:hypothetical protein
MNELLNHVKNSCPHFNTPSRQALRNNRFDLYEWDTKPQVIEITEDLKKNCKPCSKRDVKKYQALIKKGSLPPAIITNTQEDILDGAHRLQALINEGYTSVLAYVGIRKN